MNRFIHLGINPVGNSGIAPPANYNAILEAYLNQVCPDWFRYASQNYVIWTNLDMQSLAGRILELPGLQNMYVFATVFTSGALSSNGLMPKQFWDWLHKVRF